MRLRFAPGLLSLGNFVFKMRFSFKELEAKMCVRVCVFNFVAHQGSQLTTTNINASSATRVVCYFYKYNL